MSYAPRMGRAASVIALAAVLLLGGCGDADGPAGEPAEVVRVTGGGGGFPPDAAAARRQLDGLEVAWGRNWQTYRREEFGETWSDATDALGGRNGCDTRDDVLRRDLRELREDDRDPCVVVSGTLHDPYTGRELPYTDRRATRIQTDHVVALGAAWRAGAYAWTPQRRLAYANDLDVLLAVDKQANHDKSSRTPDKWKPPRRAYWCEYARRWTGIKDKYRLSVTAPEKAALRDMLASCGQ